MFKAVLTIIGRDSLLELRRKTSMAGILIYVVSSVYICYLSFRQIIDVPTWNALLWIIILFAAINAVAKSFITESKGVQLYNYLLISPVVMILSRIAFNVFFMTILALITFSFYSLFLGNLVGNITMFACGLILGSACLASVLTLMSAIASKAGGNPSLVAVLGFPVIIPTLMTVMRYTKNAIDGLAWSVNLHYLLILGALFIISVVMAVLLFPYLWKD
jgi:heme exporter protein B